MAHSHEHHVSNYNSAFAIGIVLNLLYVIVEATYGFITDSLALLADAGHNLSDVVTLVLAWGAFALAKKAATEQRTYGFRKVTILASLASALLLLFALGAISWEAVQRFSEPRPVAGSTVMVVAFIGVIINAATAMLFAKGQKHDLNMKGAFLHMAGDAAVSLGVIITALIINITGWDWLDPAMSLAIVVVILIGTWSLLKDSINYSLDAVPNNVDISALKTYLAELPHVNTFHDLHVWPMSTTENAMTVHLVVDEYAEGQGLPDEIKHYVHDHFEIEHVTVQIEASSYACDSKHQHCGIQQ
ncbi:cation diffusion facilitator family transporter [Photobacterium angustum]|uniref:Cation transporter n=1 Tax=Photobacterium angustum TaxID=661 RepID=A0A2S7VXM3_PHOAN|nr:cation diffusion facilitator family transporter [Photobacterium angustum]PQJ66635.1 cation transporter [Photobacterium angustum]